MCGIVAYKGSKDCYPILLDGLKKLEYRGYDSAGLACLQNEKRATNIVVNLCGASGVRELSCRKTRGTNKYRCVPLWRFGR